MVAMPSSHSAAPAVPARVLVVEDDPSIAMGLQLNLEKEGYVVLTASDGEHGLAVIDAERPDLIILDVMLPKRNGLEVLHTVRARGLHMPVIVLSARTSEMDKVTGLELGAEDYVAKPFSLAELLARVKAALRRAHLHVPPKARQIEFGAFLVDADAREIRRNGEPIEMTQTEYDVLLCLLETKGKALSREEILRRVWGPNHHGTLRTVDNFVQQLRAKIEDDPQAPRYLHTVRGIGYRLDA
ncbi:MAG: response regulator transcription factor [Polyangiaceae bacterium]